MLVNPADTTQWQPSAIHGYHRVGFHPSVGYIEDHVGPALPLTTEINPYPAYSGQVDNTWYGPESKGIAGGGDMTPYGGVNVPRSSQLATGAIRSWSPTVNPGLWRRRATMTVPGGWSGWISQCISDYNGSTGKTLHLV